MIAERTLDAPGQVPIAFDLPYDAARIDPRHSDALAARITEHGEPRFTSDVSTPVIPRGAQNDVEIVLRMLSGEEVDDAEAPLGLR